MSKFEEVCSLSCDLWVSSFPEEIPEHIFSEEHNKKMNVLLKKEDSENSLKISKKRIKFILIAAILMALAVTATAIAQNKEYIIEKFSTFSEYDVLGSDGGERVTSLKVDYIPEGFVKTEEGDFLYLYENGEKNFSVEKLELGTTVGFDTEEYDSETTLINGVEAVYFRGNKDFCGIIYNDGEYIYVIVGNISKKELVKIAQGLE